MTLDIQSADSPEPISIQICGGVGAPRQARNSVLSRLEGRVSDADALDAALIVSELVTNSVVHAKVAADRAVTVELTTFEDRLRITVVDSGGPSEPRMLVPDLAGSGGFGLFIVDALAGAWGLARDCVGTTSVWCDLMLGPSRVASAAAKTAV